MDLESDSGLKAITKNNSEEFSNSEKFEEFDDEGPYSFIGTSNAILGFVIAIGAILIPVFAVLLDRPVPHKEHTSFSLEPYGSKYSVSLSLKRIS